jgi:oxalate decarboxylase/phosphoglucose isomerase-like protein (cupin superfamily)
MNFEKYKVPEGYIMIAFSDRNLSVGIMGINPGKELAKHNRPVLESLYQLKGSCVMKLFEEDGKIKEIILKEGESIDIPQFKFHIHSNPNKEESITFWKASGDIVDIINKIRNSNTI